MTVIILARIKLAIKCGKTGTGRCKLSDADLKTSVI